MDMQRVQAIENQLIVDIELKPCPLCCKKAVLIYKKALGHQIYCLNCPLVFGEVWQDKYDMLWLVNNWNNRA